MSHFIPAKGRLDFYEYIVLNLDDGEYTFDPKGAIEDAGLGMLEQIYLNQARPFTPWIA